MKNKKQGAKKSSKGISLLKAKEKCGQEKSTFEIQKAAKVLGINEMFFREQLSRYYFDSSGKPKALFIKLGFFLTFSQKVDSEVGEFHIKKIEITQEGLDYFERLKNVNGWNND